MERKIGVLVLCYNVEKTIENLLSTAKMEIVDQCAEIVAVDNCSTDSTIEALKRVQCADTQLGKKLTIIRNKKNYGLGGSQKIGFRYFLDRGFTHIMVQHGDGQGDFNIIAENFLNELASDVAVEVVLASRFTQASRTSGYSRLRRIGNVFFNFITRILTGLKMSDAGTGIMLVQTSILQQIPFEKLTNVFQFNPQLNIIIHENKYHLSIVPLHWKDSAAGTNIQAIHYCWQLLKILGSYGFRKYFLGRPGALAFDPTVGNFSPEFHIESLLSLSKV